MIEHSHKFVSEPLHLWLLIEDHTQLVVVVLSRQMMFNGEAHEEKFHSKESARSLFVLSPLFFLSSSVGPN